MSNNINDRPLENLADDPFDSDSNSGENVIVKNKTDQSLSTNKEKEIISMDPSILNLNKKLLSDIRSLSISEDVHNNEGNYDPSLDILHIEDPALLDETLNESNKTMYKDDMVYLSNIYDIFNKLNGKLDDLMDRRYIDKQIITEIYQKAKENDTNYVLEQTRKMLSDDDIQNISHSSIKSILEGFPPIISQIKNEITEIQNVKNDYDNILELLLKDEKDFSKVLSNINLTLKNKIRDFMIVYNGVNSKYQISMNAEAKDAVFKLEDVDVFLKSIFENFVEVNSENKKLSKDLDIIKTDNDIKTLNKTVESNKKMIKRLQDENISFSDAVNKLNEINIKLKKECVLISSEYKKLTESSREKKRVIEKQKKVIELLQSKLGENFNSPLEEIKSKMSNLKLDIEKEKDPEKRERLKKSFEDTSKRLEDFEAVLNKKKSENTKILQ